LQLEGGKEQLRDELEIQEVGMWLHQFGFSICVGAWAVEIEEEQVLWYFAVTENILT